MLKKRKNSLILTYIPLSDRHPAYSEHSYFTDWYSGYSNGLLLLSVVGYRLLVAGYRL